MSPREGLKLKNIASIVINIFFFFVFVSKHLYPFCLGAYPTNSHFLALGSRLPKFYSGLLINTMQPNTFKGMLEDNLDFGNSCWRILTGVINF